MYIGVGDIAIDYVIKKSHGKIVPLLLCRLLYTNHYGEKERFRK